MKSSTRPILASFVVFGFVAGSAFLIWAFSQIGTRGLFRYSYGRPLIILFALGTVLAPALYFIAQIGVKRPNLRRLQSTLFFLAGLLGLVIFGSTLSFLKTYTIPAMTPLPGLDKIGPVLVEPSAGIRPKARGEGQALLRVALSSDSHVEKDDADNEATIRILAMVGSGDYDAFFHLGDMTEYGMNPEGWLKARPMLTAGLGSVPVRPLLGNHDATIGGAEHYRSVFFPPGMKSDSGSPFYYSIEAGPVLFVVVNLLWGVEDFDPAQKAWLEKTLANCPPGKQIVLLSHCFLYSSGYIDAKTGLPWYDHAATIPELAPLLEKYHVSLSVAGHNHYMEFLKHAGVGYAVAGAMGGLPDPQPSYISPASVWRQAGAFGYLEISAWPDRLELAYIGIDGKVLHNERIDNPRPLD